MGVFVLNRLSHVSHLSDVGLTDFAIPFLGLRWIGITKSSIFCARPVLAVFLGSYPGDGAVGAFG